MNFPDLVKQEVERCRAKFKKADSWHYIYGVLMEEVDELWDEIKKKPAKRDLDNMLHELVQIAGCCQLAAEDLCK